MEILIKLLTHLSFKWIKIYFVFKVLNIFKEN